MEVTSQVHGQASITHKTYIQLDKLHVSSAFLIIHFVPPSVNIYVFTHVHNFTYIHNHSHRQYSCTVMPLILFEPPSFSLPILFFDHQCFLHWWNKTFYLMLVAGTWGIGSLLSRCN